MAQKELYGYDNSLGLNIRLCVFLAFSVCVFLLALIWALRYLLLHRLRISAFIHLLLINDLAQLPLNLIMVIFSYWGINRILWFWSSFSLCGFLLHQLVALEGILTLKYPQISAHIFSLPCYIIITILVMFYFTLNTITFFIGNLEIASGLSFSLGTTLASLGLLAVSFIITFKAPPTPAIRNTHLVFAVAMVTFVMLYFPFMLVSCLHFFIDVPIYWFNMSFCLLNLRLVSDPLLCGLVCRENLRDVQIPETHTEPNDDQTAK